jgi:hypothetical protein
MRPQDAVRLIAFSWFKSTSTISPSHISVQNLLLSADVYSTENIILPVLSFESKPLSFGFMIKYRIYVRSKVPSTVRIKILVLRLMLH